MQAYALVILAAFYAVYLGKLVVQKRQGIETDQLAKGDKRDRVYYLELILKITTYGIVLVELWSIYINRSDLATPFRYLGMLLALLGLVIFILAVLEMRNNWRAGLGEAADRELVTTGLYAFSRNPAFLGFDLVYLGILFMFTNPLHIIVVVAAILLMDQQIRSEERFLQSVFGQAYTAYAQRVRRYL